MRITGDEIRAQREKCADCGGQLQEIKVIQTGHSNVHLPLVFAVADAKMHKWTGTYPVEGTVLAFRCSSCARIFFYGAANESKDKAKGNAADADR